MALIITFQLAVFVVVAVAVVTAWRRHQRAIWTRVARALGGSARRVGLVVFDACGRSAELHRATRSTFVIVQLPGHRLGRMALRRRTGGTIAIGDAVYALDTQLAALEPALTGEARSPASLDGVARLAGLVGNLTAAVGGRAASAGPTIVLDERALLVGYATRDLSPEATIALGRCARELAGLLLACSATLRSAA